VTVNAAEAVTANFTAITTNLVFVSSSSHPPNLGGTAPYDTICNQLATAAGINNAAGTNFSAWISDANSNALARLGNATGWVRMDGRVFASTRIGLLNGQIFNPVRFTETGADAGDTFYMTGTSHDGTTAINNNCLNWTTNANTSGWLAGAVYGGPAGWSAGAGQNCANGNYPLLCMMKVSSVIPTPMVYAGKKVWMTNGPFVMPSPTTVDAMCNTDRPTGVNTGRALIARTTATAASLVTANQMYVRPDGQEVGTGAELAAGLWRAGIWQLGNGNYAVNLKAWTGSGAMSQLGTAATTCGDWADATGLAGRAALVYPNRNNWWSWAGLACNTTAANGAPYLYCYEP